MDEATLKLEARITAIEYLLSDLWAKWYLVFSASNSRVEQAHQDCLGRLKLQTFPGIDPTMSDAFAAELEEAVSRILAMQRTMLAAANSKLGRS